MYCPNCGSVLPVDASFCPKCGARVPGNSETTTGYSPAAPSCDRPEPAVPSTYGAAGAGDRRTEWVAAILSLFITGLGTIYAGDTERGVILLIVQVAATAVTIFLLLPFIAPVLVWLVGIAHAVISVQKHNSRL